MKALQISRFWIAAAVNTIFADCGRLPGIWALECASVPKWHHRARDASQPAGVIDPPQLTASRA
jgi:hypothetical protein